jgi:hypothetical protein
VSCAREFINDDRAVLSFEGRGWITDIVRTSGDGRGTATFVVMTRRRSFIVAILLASAAMIAGAGFLVNVVVGRGDDQAEMLRVTRQWARLDPLPEPHSKFSITSSGGMFSRSFEATFVADDVAIDSWLKSSPGTRNVKPTHDSGDVKTYQIVPGGGAQRASVSVNERTHTVRITAIWS